MAHRVPNYRQRAAGAASLCRAPPAVTISPTFGPKEFRPHVGDRVAHCCLGPYWSQRLGKTELVGYQASARGGEVRVRVAGPRVFLGGKAVTVVKGEVMA